jgi:hypothetical protein
VRAEGAEEGERGAVPVLSICPFISCRMAVYSRLSFSTASLRAAASAASSCDPTQVRPWPAAWKPGPHSRLRPLCCQLQAKAVSMGRRGSGGGEPPIACESRATALWSAASARAEDSLTAACSCTRIARGCAARANARRRRAPNDVTDAALRHAAVSGGIGTSGRSSASARTARPSALV